MQLAETREGGVTILQPVGPLIANELEPLNERLAALRQNWTKRIVINMHEVPFVDSAGLELLVRHRRELDTCGLALKLADLTDTVTRILQLTRLSGRFEVFRGTPAAVRSFL
jgi:anti-anti-sigma factor